MGFQPGVTIKRWSALAVFVLLAFYFRACLNRCGWFIPGDLSVLGRLWTSAQRAVFPIDRFIARPTHEWPSYLIFTAAYALVVWVVGRCPPRRFAELAIAAGLAGAILLFARTLFSTDVHDYLIRGRLLVVHHANPYVVSPNAFPKDPYFSLIGWPAAVWVYGPLWLLIVSVVAALPLSILGAVMALRVLLLGAHLANGRLVWETLGDTPSAIRARRTALYLFCPLALWETTNAHCDLLMVTFLLLGVVCARRRKIRAASLWLTAAALVKAYAAPALFFFILAELGRGDRQTRRQAALHIALPPAVLALALYAPFVHTLPALLAPFRGVAANAVGYSWASVAVAGAWLTAPQALAVARIAMAAAVGYGAFISARSGRWGSAAAWFFLIFCSSATWFEPWYAIMALAFAMADESPTLHTAGIVLAVLAPVAYMVGCMRWSAATAQRIYLDSQLAPLDAALFVWMWAHWREPAAD